MRAAANRRARAGRAFTLVELVTVIAILGILVTIMVGAIQGLRHKLARDATRAMFKALNTGLEKYYQDWGKYPFNKDVDSDGDGVDDMVEIPATTDPGCTRLVPGATYDAEAVLYAALTAKQRRGPYFGGGEAQTVIQKEGDRHYVLFADGWGRPIRYEKPRGADQTAPFLYSFGVNGIDDGGGSGSDDITNY